MAALWTTLTPAQATVVAGIFTFAGAIIAVLVGYFLVRGRFIDLKAVVDETDNLMKGHKASTEQSLGEISSQFQEFVKSIDEQLGQLRAQVNDKPAAGTENLTDNALEGRERLIGCWNPIRDDLERKAADVSIDGRTRAKYWRIDRRNPMYLVDTLAGDGKLGDNAEQYRHAVNLWSRFRTGRATPSPENIQEMCRLRDILIPRGR